MARSRRLRISRRCRSTAARRRCQRHAVPVAVTQVTCVGVYMAVMLLFSIACLLALPETRGRSPTEAR